MAQQILTISQASLLEALQIKEEGEIAYAADTEKYYKYSDGAWVETEIENPPTKQELRMTMYDMNKQLIRQLPIFDEARKKDMAESIRAWKRNDVNMYMLYGKEISYFTLFQKQVLAANDFVSALFKCLDNFEGIYNFEIVDENTIELWVKYEDDATCMYLFNYDEGVVIYNG